MWFGKKKFANFAMTLAVAVASLCSSAWAAEVYPFSFGNSLSEEENQIRWDKLMTFKMWGTEGITLGHAKMPRVAGSVGTAKGDLLFKDEDNHIGGAIYVGGNIRGFRNDHFLTGPVRATGNFSTGGNSSTFAGLYCIEGSANLASGDQVNGTLYTGDDAKTGECAYDKVDSVPVNLAVPTNRLAAVPSDAIMFNGVIPLNDTRYIDVPPIVVDANGEPKKMYDFYAYELTFDGQSKLFIRMQSSKSLARIFLQTTVHLTSSAVIQVVYVDENAQYDYQNHRWTNITEETPVKNKDYAGNLLFYMKGNMEWPSMNGHPKKGTDEETDEDEESDKYARVQGSFMSEGIMKLGSNLTLAGQLLAKEITIDNEFDGSSFRYKPFDPATVDLATASDRSNHLQEGREHNYVNLVLDKKAITRITFDYCFEAKGDPASHKGDGKKLASKFDFGELNSDSSGIDNTWYNEYSCPTVHSAYFDIGESTLAEPIEVKVYDDDKYEDDEEFIMHISNLDGAVLQNGLSSGTITLTIDDNDGQLKSKSGTAVTVIEDTKYTFGLNDFPIFENDGTTPWKGTFNIRIVTPPSYKDSLKIANKTVVLDKDIPSDSILDEKTRYLVMDYNPPHDSFGIHFDSLEFKVAREGGSLSESIYKLYINITPVNDKPEVSSNGFKIYEHGKTSIDRIATGGFDIVDPDDSTFSYKFSIGAKDSADFKKVDSLFVIDSANGTISVKEDIDLNYESDSLLYVYVVVKDSSKSTGNYEDALADTVKVGISILDTNEAPVIADQVFEVAENSKKGTEVLPKDWKEGDPKNVQAEDPDLPTAKNDWGKFKYSIEENPNFVIDSITGLITVKDKANLDFEDKTKNEFNLSVYVKDGGGLVDSAIVTIKVTNVNESPEFEDDGSDNFFAFEHSKPDTVIKRWTVYDPDADDDFSELTVSLADSNGKASIKATEIFDVRLVENKDSIFAELFVKDSAKLDFETIYKTLGDSVFTVIVSLMDDDSSTSSLTKHVVVRDINENPTIVNKQKLIDDGLNVDENSNAGDTVGTIVATDPDIWNEFSYRIADGDALNGKGDSAYFNIDKNGVITVAKSGTLDYETDSIYVIKVIVTDNGKSKGFENLSDSVVFTIKLNDKNEPPEIDPDPDPDPDCVGEKCNECDATIKDCGKPKVVPPDSCTENCGYKDDKGRIIVNVREHSPKDFVILEYVIRDSEKGDLERDTVFFENTNNSGADKIFGIKKETADNVNYKLVVFVKDSSKLDYETAKHSHDLTLVVADMDDLALRDTVLRVINIIDINENPVIADTTLTIKENRPNGTVVGDLRASDPDTSVRYSTLTYNILDKVPFKMDSNKVIVADASKLNYEKQIIFTFLVSVSDGELADTATVTVELEDDNDAPDIIPDLPDDPDCVGEKCKVCDATFAKCDNPPDELDPDCVDGKCGFVKGDTIHVGIRENSPKGTKILEYYVEDEDAGDLETMEVSFKDKNKSGSDSLFVITDKLVKDSHGYKFELSVKTDSLDYETTKHEHFIVIYVKDKGGLVDSVFRVIDIIDINETPFIKNAPFDLFEHNKPNIVIDSIEWGDDRDIEGISNPKFQENRVTLLGGDTAFFDVDSMGVITVKKRLNYETDDTTYVLYVSAVDRNDPSLFMADSVIIHLKNVPEIPYITTTEFDVDENPKKGQKIGQLESEDKDDLKNEQKRTYTVADNKYVEVTEDGEILVKDSTLFDYEKIKEFVIDVTVTDTAGLSSTSKVTITINDVNEAPEIKDKTIDDVPEDTKPGSIIDTVKATDPDTSAKFSKLTYTIVKGDTSTFKIDPEKGIVTLKKKLDYEDKNKYELKVRVDDGKLADTATVMVYVKDVEERSNVEITVVDDHDAPPYNKPDSVYTRQPVVELCWHTGRTEGKKTSWNDEKCESEKLELGENVIIKDYYDPTTNFPALDTVVIFYSNTLPEVTISANGDGRSPHNIYTIVETTDAKDSNIYVNKKSNDIFVTVYDPALALKNDKDSLQIIKIPTDLDTVHVSSKYYDSMNYVVKEGVSLDPIADNAVRNLNKDSSVNVSYVTKVGGIEVTVSYTENKKGDVVKTPVKHSDGKVSMDEVMTVTYLTKDKDGKEISVSYKADAITGKPLKVDSEGNLMTDGAAKSEKGPSGLSTVGIFTVSYSQASKSGDSLKVSYAVDEKGKLIASSSGDIGYHVSYTYTDICGNSATKSVFIVLDKYEPKVEILYPTHGDIIYSNFVTVKWTVDGEVQDTLNTQGLEKGANIIVRFYRDKAGNEASDTVFVIMKDGKKVDLAVEQPVTEISKDKVDEYYSKNQPKEGQTYAVSIKNPTTGKEVVTEIGGSFGRNDVSEKKNEPYPGVKNPSSHLGPTLVLDVKVPVISGTSGLATMDDIMSKDGMILVEGIDASGDIVGADSTGSDKNVAKISVEDYIFGKKNSKDTSSLYRAHCVDEVRERYKPGDDFSKINLYNSKLTAKIWIYSSLGNFVDYYSFEQPLNDPDLVDESGLLKMYFELKPDKDGIVRSEDGRAFATGAYVYKVEAKVRSEVLCDIPSLTKKSGKKMGDIVKNDDNLLKSFGYRRPVVK